MNVDFAKFEIIVECPQCGISFEVPDAVQAHLHKEKAEEMEVS